MLATGLEVMLTILANTVCSSFIFVVIGFFTQKKLHPRYEDLIKDRVTCAARPAWGAGRTPFESGYASTSAQRRVSVSRPFLWLIRAFRDEIETKATGASGSTGGQPIREPLFASATRAAGRGWGLSNEWRIV